SSDLQLNIHDGFGHGVKLTFIHKMDGLPNLLQSFYFYEKHPYLFTEVTIESTNEISTNYIAPLVSERLDTTWMTHSEDADLRSLFVPFDNDKWVRYQSNPIDIDVESYEVTSVFNNTNRNGVVFGSVSHHTWKTGLKLESYSNESGEVGINVYGGASSEFTRDSLPHGFVKGKIITSPRIFIGVYEDYRDGLEAYGKANSVLEPSLQWDEGVPFGWNSWSAVADKLDYDVYIATSDFYKTSLQNNHFENNGTVYINFDSYWDKLSEQELLQAVDHVHKNGQKAGIYFTPFAYWSEDFEKPINGTNNRYTYNDALLRDFEGNVLPALDGGYPLDPTHPGTIERIKWQFQKFIEWGFDYVKLDFMAHGALEGVHYNEQITTGIQAYNFGMQEIVATLDPKKIGRPFFINLSIAPMFPAQYAHSRRISCDAFGSLQSTEYMLNSLSYGWWMNGTIYKYNDPDHTVIYKSFNEDPITENEALSRFNASVIAGTVLLGGDDFRSNEARKRAKKLFTNKEVNELAKRGVSFIPVEGNSGDKAVDTFVIHDRETDATFVAIFNYNSDKPTVKHIQLTRLGLSDSGYRVYNLWKKEEYELNKELQIQLGEAESTILKITAMG